ncbi:Outer membrane protein TolC [Pedobacter steynii]|uniref:Outer membrane protein TolC n=1 Tax=Pedobacter steynii TaxID=430522 RepID=A0A1H0AZT5_9SPHI|nr:TolC family protein [Pedobacter steynii]NQX41205.1 TolC family protein [Pedobacter steynii]SDN38918.1 Outer membrane protein TolC [Pedobacter steynii]
MPKPLLFVITLFGILTLGSPGAGAQMLKLKDAISTALNNYGSIKAKGNYVSASEAGVQQARRDYLPNLSLSAQQDYGTINGQNGPSYGLGGLGVASSGPSLDRQNWNAAFGALYLANINWDFFTFGRIKEKIKVAQTLLKRDENDLAQEKFQHEIRVSAAYLNLIAAQRLRKSQERNLDRAITFKNTAVIRASNGLIAGVDSSLAKAEVSSAKIALTKAKDLEQEQANRLGILMGITATDMVLDTASITRVPGILYQDSLLNENAHPLLKYYRNRVELSDEQAKLFRKSYYPSFSLFGVMQGRGSGFSSAYAQNQTAFTQNYADGINPVRGNYLVGVGMVWNLTSILRAHPQVRAQEYLSKGLQNEYELAGQQLQAQVAMANVKLKNAVDNYNEAPVQVKAASDAYLQKSTLYKNGLSTIVDLTQALYTLNRAETDRDIAYTNVWQALLLKSAALGNFDLFINEF